MNFSLLTHTRLLIGVSGRERIRHWSHRCYWFLEPCQGDRSTQTGRPPLRTLPVPPSTKFQYKYAKEWIKYHLGVGPQSSRYDSDQRNNSSTGQNGWKDHPCGERFVIHIPQSFLEYLGFSGLLQDIIGYITVNTLLITMIMWLNMAVLGPV